MKYLRYIVTTLLVTTIFGGYFYYLTVSGQIEQNPISNTIVAAIRPYPTLSEPKEVILSCDYHGKPITVSETLYGSLYRYYQTDPVKKSAYLHNNEKDFVFSYDRDGTIKELASKITAAGTENGLVGDQVLDLGACLMQGIPYDEAKAARILGPDFSKLPVSEVVPRYPYETLYDNLGICTDKTYLGAAVIRELGYSTAIMTFDTQKHMSLGVAVPAGYGSFGSAYGIMELTGNNFLVGDIPDLNASAGLAINNFQTLPQGGTEAQTANQLQLAKPSQVVPVSTGSSYNRVIERTATRQKLVDLRAELETLQTSYKQAGDTLATAEADLNTAETNYKLVPNNANYKLYQQSYGAYTASYNDAQNKINQYNNAVNLYNSYVAKYRQF